MFKFDTRNCSKFALGFFQIMAGLATILGGTTTADDDDTATAFAVAGLTIILAGWMNLTHSMVTKEDPSCCFFKKRSTAEKAMGGSLLVFAMLALGLEFIVSSSSEKKLLFGAAAGLSAGGGSTLLVGMTQIHDNQEDSEERRLLP